MTCLEYRKLKTENLQARFARFYDSRWSWLFIAAGFAFATTVDWFAIH